LAQGPFWFWAKEKWRGVEGAKLAPPLYVPAAALALV